jgi:putative spermidine/putrescine transport system permease protein
MDETMATAQQTAPLRPARPRWRLWGLSKPLIGAFAGLVLVFLLLPAIVIVVISFSSAQYLTFPPPGWSLQWYREFFSSPDWVTATVRSIQIGLGTVALSLALGVPLSFVLVRTQFRGKPLVDALVLAPMILPAIILAIGDYLLFVRLKLVGTMWGLILGHTVIALPFMVVNVRATLRGVDPYLEKAASSLGANPLTVFRTITLPLMMPGVITGSLFAFITSFDEVVIALFLSGPYTQTLPMRMWSGLRYEIEPTIAAVSSLLIMLAAILLTFIQFTRGRNNPETR